MTQHDEIFGELPFDDDELGDGTDTVQSFADPGKQQLEVVDRSGLERCSVCPAQARIVDDGLVQTGNMLTETGNEIHRCYSEFITDYINDATTDFAISRKEYVDRLERLLYETRPDVQPDVVDAASRAIWKFVDLILEYAPRNILHYDGGEATGRSGQLAVDLPECGIRYTSELDLLCSTPNPKQLREVDYKSGWKYHDSASIFKSFQFQSHWFLVADRYRDVESLAVDVFNVRKCKFETAVFDRDDLPAISTRIHSAAGIRNRWRNCPLQDVPCWPMVGRCETCDARAKCPMEPPPSVADAPEQAVLSIVALEAKLDSLKADAAAYVDKIGADIVAGGVAFGRSKPPSDRKPTAVLYELDGPPKKTRAKKVAEVTDAIVGAVKGVFDEAKRQDGAK